MIPPGCCPRVRHSIRKSLARRFIGRGKPVSAPPEPPWPGPEPRGDAHAGGPYASFYPEDDLGGWQDQSRGCGAWEDLPEPEVDCRHAENFLAYWLAEKFLSDE